MLQGPGVGVLALHKIVQVEVASKCLHLLLRNFVRRPFHAPALGPRVAQLGYLAVHGLRQPAHVVRCRCPCLRSPSQLLKACASSSSR